MLKRVQRHHRFMWTYSRALFSRIGSRPAFVFLIFMTFTSMLFFSVLFYLIEHNHNASILRWFDALYFTVATMTTVGFGDLVPRTDGGRVVAMLMMLSGTMIFVSFTAVVSSVILELELEHKEHL